MCGKMKKIGERVLQRLRKQDAMMCTKIHLPSICWAGVFGHKDEELIDLDGATALGS